MDTNILLESGTNELEILEFTLADNHYGINVAKIREILSYQKERQYNLKIDGKDVDDLTGKMVELVGTSIPIGVTESGVSAFDAFLFSSLSSSSFLAFPVPGSTSS